MSTRAKQLCVPLIALGIVTLAISSCGKQSAPAGAACVAFQLQWQGADAARQAPGIMRAAPSGVSKVKLSISASDMTTISQTFDASAGTGSIGNVTPGTNRTITFEGLDSGNTTKYGASVTGVTLTAGQTYDCGRMTMVLTAWTMAKLPDTGQTTTTSSTFGQDADYTINPPSYTDNGDGTITDNVTTLVWQKQDDGTTRSWENAISYCDDLTLATYTDWRLPGKKELLSIVNFGKYNPAIDIAYFPDTKSSDYWSSTSAADGSTDAWYVSFLYGNVSNFSKTNSNYVRCVRSGQ